MNTELISLSRCRIALKVSGDYTMLVAGVYYCTREIEHTGPHSCVVNWEPENKNKRG